MFSRLAIHLLMMKYGYIKKNLFAYVFDMLLLNFPETVSSLYVDMAVHGGFGSLLGWKLYIPYPFSYEKVTSQSSDLSSLNSDHDAFPQTTREINKWLKSRGVKGKNGKEG